MENHKLHLHPVLITTGYQAYNPAIHVTELHMSNTNPTINHSINVCLPSFVLLSFQFTYNPSKSYFLLNGSKRPKLKEPQWCIIRYSSAQLVDSTSISVIRT